MGYQVSLFTVCFVLHWKYCMLLTYATAFLLVGVFLTTTHNVVRNEHARARARTHTHTHTHTHIHSLICLFSQQFATSLLLANKFDEFTVAISYYLANFDLLMSVSYLHLKTPCIWKSRMCTLYTYNCSFMEWVKNIFWGLPCSYICALTYCW